MQIAAHANLEQHAVHKLPHNESLECIFPGNQCNLFTIKAFTHASLSCDDSYRHKHINTRARRIYRSADVGLSHMCWCLFGFKEHTAENYAWGDA